MQKQENPPEIASPQHSYPAHSYPVWTSNDVLGQALGHHHAGQIAEAEHCYCTVLALQPTHAVALYGLGVLWASQGRLLHAIEVYRRAIAARPDFIDAYINLGTAMLSLGRHKDAIDLYQHAIALAPHNAMALGNLGKALQDLGRTDEAIAAYRAGLAHQPDNAIINSNLAAALLNKREWEAAEAVTQRAIALNPTNMMAYANRGSALLHLGRHDDALTACHQAIALRPSDPASCATLGGLMLELGAWEQAEQLCRQAVALDPNLASAHFNLSHAFKATNRLEQAEAAARQAIALQPGSVDYHFHLAHILLLKGDLEAGWDEYEWRLQLPGFAWIGALLSERPRPRWAGEDISDKTILVHTEQGLGDIIQFARYLPLVVKRAKRVVVAAHPPVCRLLECIDDIDVIPILQMPRVDFDVHCPLLSLPRVFRTRLDTIPESVPYLWADAAECARWKKRLSGDGLRVGIVWAGNPATERDRFRSPGLSSILPLLNVPNIDFVALQVGPGRDGSPAWPPHVIDLGAEITDLTETAAIMGGLDLMISSCTAPLHLAGSLGLPCWAMIPFAPHFPWLLERTDTLWYPNTRLYRQEQPGRDWSGVVGRMASDLGALAGSRRHLTQTPA